MRALWLLWTRAFCVIMSAVLKHSKFRFGPGIGASPGQLVSLVGCVLGRGRLSSSGVRGYPQPHALVAAGDAHSEWVASCHGQKARCR